MTAMSPVAQKMMTVLNAEDVKFKLVEIRLGHRSDFTVHLGNYSEEVVKNITKSFSNDSELSKYRVRFRAGLKGIPGAKKSIYRLTKVDTLGMSVEEL